MTPITHCPSCGTHYAVRPELLKTTHNWRHCGQCGQGFDSKGRALNWPKSWVKTPHNPAQPQPSDQRVDIDTLLKSEDRSPLVASAVMPPAKDQLHLDVSTPQAISDAQQTVKQTSTNTPSPAQTLGFGQKTKTLWQALGATLLLLALALQWLWIGRHVIAAQHTDLDKAFSAVCAALKCEILPLQIRDGLVIEGSGLTPHGDGLLLSWSVRNRTAHKLQMPALELTLLDAKNKATIRRVLPTQQQHAPSFLSAQNTWQGQLHLVHDPSLSPTGYRLVVFYP